MRFTPVAPDDTPTRLHFEETKPCCTICDAKKTCSVCGQQTLLACSDCRIDFQTTIYVCKQAECRERHKAKCPYELRAEVSRLREDLNTAETLKALDMAETIIELRADVSRLQQENALLRRSLEMLSRDV
jgi:hypothetical protein